MLEGYEAFGKSHVDTQSGRTSLETMRKISRMIDGLITVDEEAMQCIQVAHEDAFTEWNDVIDMELREVLDSVFCAIATSKNCMMNAKVQLNNCIQRRIDYLCSLNEIMTDDEDDESCDVAK